MKTYRLIAYKPESSGWCYGSRTDYSADLIDETIDGGLEAVANRIAEIQSRKYDHDEDPFQIIALFEVPTVDVLKIAMNLAAAPTAKTIADREAKAAAKKLAVEEAKRLLAEQRAAEQRTEDLVQLARLKEKYEKPA